MCRILLNKSLIGEDFADKQSIYNSVLIDIDSAKFIADTFTGCAHAHPQPTPAVIGLQIALISPTLNTRPLYLYLTCTFTK